MLLFCFLVLFIKFLNSEPLTIILENNSPYVICPESPSMKLSGIIIQILNETMGNLTLKENIDYKLECLKPDTNFSEYLLNSKVPYSILPKQKFSSNDISLYNLTISPDLINSGFSIVKFQHNKVFWNSSCSYYFCLILFLIPLCVGLAEKVMNIDKSIIETLWGSYSSAFYMRSTFVLKKMSINFITQGIIVFFLIAYYTSILTLDNLKEESSIIDKEYYRKNILYTNIENFYGFESKFVIYFDRNYSLEQIYYKAKSLEAKYFAFDSFTIMYLERKFKTHFKFIETKMNIFSYNLFFNNYSNNNFIKKINEQILIINTKNEFLNENNLFFNDLEILPEEENLSTQNFSHFSLLFVIFAIILCISILQKTLILFVFTKIPIVKEMEIKSNPYFERKFENLKYVLNIRKSSQQIFQQSNYLIKNTIRNVKIKFIYNRFADYNILNEEETTINYFGKDNLQKKLKKQIIENAQHYIQIFVDQGYYKSDKFRKKQVKKQKTISSSLMRSLTPPLLISIDKSKKNSEIEKNKIKNEKNIIKTDRKTLYQIIVSNVIKNKDKLLNISSKIKEKETSNLNLKENKKAILKLGVLMKQKSKEKKTSIFKNQIELKRRASKRNASFVSNIFLKKQEFHEDNFLIDNTSNFIHNLPYNSEFKKIKKKNALESKEKDGENFSFDIGNEYRKKISFKKINNEENEEIKQEGEHENKDFNENENL